MFKLDSAHDIVVYRILNALCNFIRTGNKLLALFTEECSLCFILYAAEVDKNVQPCTVNTGVKVQPADAEITCAVVL